MSCDLNVDEVFAFAREIEENHAAFYFRAAAMMQQPRVRRLLENLAQKEGEHAATFARLAADCGGGRPAAVALASADGRAANLYELRDMVRGQVFGRDVKVADHLPPDAGVQEVLDLAVEAENKTAEFYAMLGSTLDGGARAAVERILEEEMKHVEFLSEVNVRIRK